MPLQNKWNNFTKLEILWSSSLSTTICPIRPFTPCYVSALLPPPISRRKKNQDNLSLRNFPLLTYFPFFLYGFVAAESIVKKNRLCHSPNWLERRSCLTPVPVGRESIITDSFPFFPPRYTFWLLPSPHSAHLLISKSWKPAGVAAVGWPFPWNNEA